jgi:hypothetical protein
MTGRRGRGTTGGEGVGIPTPHTVGARRAHVPLGGGSRPGTRKGPTPGGVGLSD